MTDSPADRVASVVLGAAVAGAVYYVLKTPSLRRVAWRLTTMGLTVSLPAWFRREIQQAWRESRRPTIRQS
jgi:uncharacterized membrane protein